MTNSINQKTPRSLFSSKNQTIKALLAITIKYYLFSMLILIIGYLIQSVQIFNKTLLLIITPFIISIPLGLFTSIKEKKSFSLERQSKIKEFLKNSKKLYVFSLMEQEYCEWIQKRTYIDLLKEAETEIKEVFNAKTKKEITEELGDLYRDVLLTMIIAWRDDVSAHPSQILENTYQKIKKRKPFVEKQIYTSEKEAIKIWNKAKNNEKNTFQK